MTKSLASDDGQFVSLLLPVWEFLAPADAPSKADVIFVFGGLDLAIPNRAAELFAQGYAPVVLISGSSGPLTKDVFSSSEAAVFRAEMIKRGVQSTAILIEEKAKNTGENVRFGMERLKQEGIDINKAILVAKSFLARRCAATFAKLHPEVAIISCPPAGSLLEFVDRPRLEFAQRLLDELARLVDYQQRGFIASVTIPSAVTDQAGRIAAWLARAKVEGGTLSRT